MDLKKNNVIKKRDFERYEIILPFTASAGKRKKQFLCSELEKMHPCFSDEFTFDSSLKSVKREGFKENVFVMNKYKLAEYEGKRHFSGSGFYIEDSENHFRRKFFVNTKWKLTVWGVLCCVFLGSAGCISGILAGSMESMESWRNNAGNGARGTASLVSVETGGIEIVENTDALECPGEVVFFDTVSKAGGKIKSFEWRMDGFNQRFTASVKGVFPEMFPETFTSNSYESGTKNIVYENGVPQMAVSYMNRIIVPENSGNLTGSLEGIETADFNKSLREIVFDSGARLKEERTMPCHIDFVCAASGTKTEMLFKKLAEKIYEEKRTVTAVSASQSGVDSSGAAQLQIGITVEKLPISDKGFDLSLISDNLPLFVDETIYTSTKKKLYANQGRPPEQQNTRNKIGEIRKPDRKIVVFYKNSEGKMEVEK